MGVGFVSINCDDPHPAHRSASKTRVTAYGAPTSPFQGEVSELVAGREILNTRRYFSPFAGKRMMVATVSQLAFSP